MNDYYKGFRRLLGLAVLADIILGALAIFLPNTMLRLLGQPPSHDVWWTAFGGLAILLIALLCKPAAKDPLRYRDTASHAVAVQGAFALFILVIWPGRYTLFGIVHLILFLLLGILLFLARREPQPEWLPGTD